MWHVGFWGFPFFPFLSLLFWFLIISFVFRWGRWGHYHRGWQNTPSAEDIVRERFAKGEIDEKEYKERLSVLRERAKGGETK